MMNFLSWGMGPIPPESIKKEVKIEREDPYERTLSIQKVFSLSDPSEENSLGKRKLKTCMQQYIDPQENTNRLRTTFTEEQLQVLQANFKLDSNPDNESLEKIAQITGLSKRVTQVWFQNFRARQKKYRNQTKKAYGKRKWKKHMQQCIDRQESTNRIRTTFTEEQLQVLQANFNINSRPDSQKLERIAEITGLSKQVTQIWFQNTRAKHRKYLSQAKKANALQDNHQSVEVFQDKLYHRPTFKAV